ncbi:uncharacterized protein BDV17DRAFT_249584 [Aspergillus undulatus]|uniref:uncharacterized protein n=1 Tax=Aspergillus undulatus TaxID=1810928 RepID=UPI003CCD62D3
MSSRGALYRIIAVRRFVLLFSLYSLTDDLSFDDWDPCSSAILSLLSAKQTMKQDSVALRKNLLCFKSQTRLC